MTDDLGRKALVGLVQFQLALALMLFLPAWSLRFPQAWAYWIIFGLCCLVITLYFLKHDPALVRSRIAVGVKAEKQKSQKIIQGLATIFLCALFIVPGLERRAHGSPVPISLVIAGDVFVLVAFAVFVVVFRQNRHASSIVEVKSDQQVISTGLYGYVRHPMYSAAILLFVATPLALGSFWALACVIPLIAVIIARLLDEERYLVANLPGYDSYRGKVRYRLIPYAW